MTPQREYSILTVVVCSHGGWNKRVKEDELTSLDPFENEDLRTKLIKMIKINILWWCATALAATPNAFRPHYQPGRDI